MFDNEIREIFELCLRVHKETDHRVGFDVNRRSCCILIKEYESDSEGYDGVYDIFRGSPNPEREKTQTECEKAKAHLLKLLGKEDRNEAAKKANTGTEEADQRRRTGGQKLVCDQ